MGYKLDKPALKESVADTLMGTAINLPRREQMLLNKTGGKCLLECMYKCKISVYKRLCNGERANCTAPPERCMVATIYRVCGCAIAHACTCAHAPLKGAWILVRAAVRTCISIENYRKVYTHTLSLGEIGSLEKQVINTI
jgi:hypothetical protein